MNEGHRDELLRAAHHYLETFLRQRDPDASAALASDRICGFGTGGDEKVYTIERALALYQSDVEALPSPIDYQLHATQSLMLGPDTGLVMGEMDWHFTHLEQAVTLFNIRFTLVLCREQGHWRLAHKHLSQPSQAHSPTEGYPLKELEERKTVLERLVRSRTEELEHTNRQMQKLAITDVLTGLYNRIRTNEVLDSEIKRQSRQPQALGLILMDLDHFKAINDHYGHREGDRVLKAVARTLDNRARETDCLGRWGGEEFILICPDTDQMATRQLAESLRLTLAETHFDIDTPVTLSLGLTGYRPGDTRDRMIERADQALYRAKKQGRNRVMVAP